MYIDFVELDGKIVSNDIFTTKFTCDLEACKGACCTMQSEYGAPILSKEISAIENILNIIFGYLPEKSVKTIIETGFWEEKSDTLMLKSINKRECVFVYYDNDIAKCAIEKAYNDGKVDFRKPISCHLFPIRINDFGGPVLKFEEYSECLPALKKGEETNISVFEFCREALERAYGKEFYQKLYSNFKEY
ncbi:MAG: DUF3109 family protein [Melioribacteraceae bacterium]|nr:DUF3109 family protein [Melioribacteraceae bacterium]